MKNLIKFSVTFVKINKTFTPIFLLAIITILLYGNILDTFYQQDEWQTVGNNIILKNFWEVFSNFDLLNFISVQERSASNTLSYFLLGKFAFNTTLMGLYSLLLHVINSILVYVIIRRWVIKDNIFALVGSLFFAVSDVSMSAVSWFGTSLGTLPATTLILLALIFYLRYIEIRKKKFILITLLFLYVSFFFKEIGIFLLVFFPFASLLFLRYGKKDFFYTFWSFFAVFLLTTSIRIVNLVFLSDRSGELFVTSAQENFIPSIVIRTLMYPLTSFSLAFIPPEPLVTFAKYFTNIYYHFVPSEHFNLVAQTIVIDIFAVFLTFILLAAIYLAVRNENRNTKKVIAFWILFFVLSFLPYILLNKSFAYLESRYYYLASLPAGILLGFLGFSLKRFLDKRQLGIFAIILLVMFLMMHAKFLGNDLTQLVLISRERINFLNQLRELKPSLDENRNIFFLTGDHNYYISGNNVPFQQGIGYTFMVLYYPTGRIPGELIKERFLWDLNTQGYREINDLGFGFFNDEKELHNIIEKYNLTKDQITGLYYDSGLKELKKIGLSLQK